MLNSIRHSSHLREEEKTEESRRAASIQSGTLLLLLHDPRIMIPYFRSLPIYSRRKLHAVIAVVIILIVVIKRHGTAFASSSRSCCNAARFPSLPKLEHFHRFFYDARYSRQLNECVSKDK